MNLTGKLVSEMKSMLSELKGTDRKTAVIFLSIALLQTISYYFVSDAYFAGNIYYNPEAEGIELLYGYFYTFACDTVLMLFLPLLVIRYCLKEKITAYGFSFRNTGAALEISLICLIFIIPGVWYFSSDSAMPASYRQFFLIREKWEIFFIFESAVLFYMVAWEFLWRGYLLFGLKERYGAAAVFMQMLPFVIMHNGKPFAETLTSIAGAILLALLALRTGTFLYGVFIHYSLFFMFDLFSVLRYRSGEYGLGISSLAKILESLFL
ncbi:MAG: type II CAAX prenyl endopeptidase Rce1 family protein [Bacteroidota bacterium]